ncbi:MAG: VUT family protein [Asticcacaulis sp.]
MSEGRNMIDGRTFLRRIYTGQARWTYLYLFLIPFINWCFDHVYTFKLPGGGDWNPMTVVTGLVLVVRDFAQREVGHYIFIFLVIGLILSVYTSDPTIAFGSACAFAVSETIDWALFTFAKLPLSKRVFVSAGISGPIDAATFLFIANFSLPGIFNWVSLAAAVISRFLGCFVVYLLMKHREKKAALTTAAVVQTF